MKRSIVRLAGRVVLSTATGMCLLSCDLGQAQETSSHAQEMQRRLAELYARDGQALPGQPAARPAVKVPATPAVPKVQPRPMTELPAVPVGLAGVAITPGPKVPATAAVTEPSPIPVVETAEKHPLAAPATLPAVSQPVPAVKSPPVPLAPPVVEARETILPAPTSIHPPIEEPAFPVPAITPRNSHPLAAAVIQPEAAPKTAFQPVPVPVAPPVPAVKAVPVAPPVPAVKPVPVAPPVAAVKPEVVSESPFEMPLPVSKSEPLPAALEFHPLESPAVPAHELSEDEAWSMPVVAKPSQVPELGNPFAPNKTETEMETLPLPLPAPEPAIPEVQPELPPVPVHAAQVEETLPAAEPQAAKTVVGLEGLCPVSLRDKRQQVLGQDHLVSEWEGAVYRFASVEEKQRFDANPAQYAPVKAGHDVTLLNHQGKEVPGSLEHAVWYRRQLYLFQSPETKNTFTANPAKVLEH